jgi:tRNA(His) 5'-end guanylyltransferase
MAESSIKTLGEYQRQLERFENTNDTLLLPDLHVIIRVDAHRIGESWGQVSDYPFEEDFIKSLRGAAKNLFLSGFRVNYAYIHGDEISILLDPLESANQRKRSRLLTLFSSYATAYFNKLSNHHVVFHAKLAELPSRSHVVDYFIWQRKVSARNFLTRKIITILEGQGLSPKEIDTRTSKLSEDERRGYLLQLGYPEEELSMSDLYGYGIWWSDGNPSRPELAGSANLGVSEEHYTTLLERVIHSAAPLIHEPGAVMLKQTSTPSATQSTALAPAISVPQVGGNTPSRKPAFRIQKRS